MKLSQLAKLVGQHLAQGKGDWEIHIFQWEHESQPVTDLLERTGILEFYSNTDGRPWTKTLNFGQAPEAEEEFDELI
jgi:hypothetical protein